MGLRILTFPTAALHQLSCHARLLFLPGEDGKESSIGFATVFSRYPRQAISRLAGPSEERYPIQIVTVSYDSGFLAGAASPSFASADKFELDARPAESVLSSACKYCGRL